MASTSFSQLWLSEVKAVGTLINRKLPCELLVWFAGKYASAQSI
ncbi:MAG: hypothetical protein ACKPCM_17135 [Pseudanabaena sp.]